jgi:parvulin-like peptidyl-prolyl isomerase
MITVKSCFDIFSDNRTSKSVTLSRLAVLCLLMLGFVVACDKIDFFSRPYVASVNGSKIYQDDYQSRLDQKMDMVPKDILGQPAYMKRFEEEVLDDMITEKIMVLRAQELNISVSEIELENKIKEIKKDYGGDFTSLFAQENVNYENWRQAFKKELLLQKLVAMDVNSKIKISDDEAKNYFNEHRDHYKKESRVRVAQIVVKDLAAAKKAEDRLNAGEDFAKVAASMSIGPEAHHGGDLGWVTRRVMPEPLDKTIFKMPANKISPIVQSSYGFHIFKVLESQPAGEGDFADVREDVMADIMLQKEDAAYINWLEDLKKKAVVKKQTNIKLKTVTRQN